MTKPILNIEQLCVHFGSGPNVVRNVNLTISKGEKLALVGESGSGKSVTAHAIMKLLPPSAKIDAGSTITFEDHDVMTAKESTMRQIRGAKIGMIFQEPMTSLNPLHKIGKQIAETLLLHQNMTRSNAHARVLEMLDLVGLERLRDRLDAYPHELSGGQRQRVMIAMALANNPDLLIADEPTTALDVTVQAQILELIEDLSQRLDMSLLLITHDLSVVKKMADRICVMKQGEIVEHGRANDIFNSPQHDYTKMLLAAQPEAMGTRSTIESDTTMLEGKDVRVHFPVGKNFFGKPRDFVKAVDDISFTIKKGETLGVVGESGSGKSTLGYACLKLVQAKGALLFDGENIASLSAKEMRPLRNRMQIVFQDPYGALSPRMSVGRIIGEGLALHRKDLSADDREAIIIKALEDVHMDPESRHRYPHEFSGGQRQRIAIARVLVLEPEFLILDEPTSALDVSTQVQIVDLLKELQQARGLTYMFISHDLRVIRAMSHDIIVMKQGKIIEHGPAKTIIENPSDPYTKALMNAALNLKAA